ncbi:uncharacterized protein RCC_02260 [Ramularia collo-cygni]|uniref:Uncharacterized protein n=1 Tax=Ramularia collo-cygni TaxID=112498 RepID=A0A2D3UW58_9PEZI|nr:uncharacterized protein RCC_02260 [Ramularia collo-cygni]CZT16417.1 uncharacterized protein RCC_02260 [Ramularia collo-cygni]
MFYPHPEPSHSELAIRPTSNVFVDVSDVAIALPLSPQYSLKSSILDNQSTTITRMHGDDAYIKRGCGTAERKRERWIGHRADLWVSATNRANSSRYGTQYWRE